MDVLDSEAELYKPVENDVLIEQDAALLLQAGVEVPAAAVVHDNAEFALRDEALMTAHNVRVVQL